MYLVGEARSEWRNWPVLVPSVLGVVMCVVHSYSLGVMIAPLEREFGWSRAEITTGPLIISIVAIVTGPLIGLAIDKYGPRKIALTGVVLYCAALALLGTSGPSISSWWIRWAVLGVANMFILTTVWTTAINSLFVVNRGKALALVLSGTGIAAFIVPGLTLFLIEQGGWRNTYFVMAALSFVLAAPVTFLLFRCMLDPSRRGDGPAPLLSLTAPPPGAQLREALRSSVFFKLTGAILLFTLAGSALTANAYPILRAQSFDPATAAQLAGLLGIGSIIGRLCGGVLLDHFDAKKVAAISVLLPVVPVLGFLAYPGSYLVGSLGWLVIGLAAGTEVDAVAYLVARHFGMRSFGTIFGTISGLTLFASGLAPLSANFVFDATGSYDAALMAVIPACLATAVVFLWLGRYPHFEQSTT